MSGLTAESGETEFNRLGHMSGMTGVSGVSDSIEVRQISHGSGMAGTVMS